MELNYGKGKVELNINPERVAAVLTANEAGGLKDPAAEIERSLKYPLGSPPLIEMVQTAAPEKVVITVNDLSRPTPYQLLLPPLLKELHSAGLKQEQIGFIIAAGLHEPQTPEQTRGLFGELVERYQFTFHNPDEGLVDCGTLSSGNRLYMNEKAASADFLITTGVILPHYFAGFSGGRKSILPGLAGRETINSNHARMVELAGKLPPLKENPINLEMLEAARRAGTDFILNVVSGSRGEIIGVFAGELGEAWYAGTEISAAVYQVPLAGRVEVAVVSPGGYPRDLNAYQAQKALEHADRATKPGGTIILLAECREGLGDKVFKKWLEEAEKPEDNLRRIRQEFVVGGHKAFAVSRVALQKEIILISELSREESALLYARKLPSLAEALAYVEEKYQGNYQAVIMPRGSLTVPLLQ